MKELSTEEKAKRYDEAIKRAREKYAMFEGMKQGDALEDVFPELKESEDERIRKEIIAFIKKRNISGCDYDYDKWIAWLEKQGKPVEINQTEFESSLNTLLKQFEKLPKEELANSLSFYLNVVQNNGTYKDEEKQGEQKSTEVRTIGYWHVEDVEQNPTCSEEDEEIRQTIINEFEQCAEWYCSNGLTKEDCINWLNKQKYFKLGDEDNENLNSLCVLLDQMVSINAIGNEHSIEYKNWLKSLKDKHTWKPSNAQMGALNAINVTGCISYAGQGQELINLFNDLKKSMEK